MNTRPISQSIASEGWSRVRDKSELSSGLLSDHVSSRCLLWTGYTVDGYGALRVQGDTYLAHRISAAAAGFGVDGMFVLHKCDQRRCVEPSHLFLGTHLDNMKDMLAKGRQRGARGVSNTNAKLNQAMVREARERFAEGESLKSIARDMGISDVCLGFAVSGKTWSHVPGAISGSKIQVGDRNHMAKVNADIVRKIRMRAEHGESHASIADDVGLSRQSVTRIVCRSAWRHVA